MLFRDDSHAKLWVRTKLAEILADCKDLDFKKDAWRCRFCGNLLSEFHAVECPIELLERAHEMLEEEDV